MLSLSHTNTDLSASHLENDINSIAADIQHLHNVACLQPVDITLFAQLERSVSFRLDCLARVLAEADILPPQASRI